MVEKKVQVSAQFVDKVSTPMSKATRSAENFGKKTTTGMGTATKAIKALKTAMFALGAVIASAAIVRSMMNMVDFAMKAEVAVASLDATIISMSRTTPNLSKELQDLARGLQRVTAFSDETIVEGQSFLATYSDITDDLMPRATQVMVDFAAKTGNGMIQAANAIGKASMGMTGELSQMGITFSEATLQSKDFLMMLDDIETQVGGLAETIGTTFHGRIEKMKNSFQDVLRAFGEMIIKSPTLNMLFEQIVDTLDDFTKSIEKMDADTVDEWFLDRIEDLANFMELWGTWKTFFMTNIIVPIVNGINEIRDNLAQLALGLRNVLEFFHPKLLQEGNEDHPMFNLWKGLKDYEEALKESSRESISWSLEQIQSGRDIEESWDKRAEAVRNFIKSVKEGKITIGQAVQGIVRSFTGDTGEGGTLTPFSGEMSKWETSSPVEGDMLSKLKSLSSELEEDGQDAAEKWAHGFGESIGAALATGDWESATAATGKMIGDFLGDEISTSLGGTWGALAGGIFGSFIGTLFNKRKKETVEKPVPVKVINWGDMTTALMKSSVRRSVSPMISSSSNMMMSTSFSREARI